MSEEERQKARQELEEMFRQEHIKDAWRRWFRENPGKSSDFNYIDMISISSNSVLIKVSMNNAQ
jgi:hypothetical protein